MNILIVGLGWFGKKHYNAWKKIGVNICGVVDKSFGEKVMVHECQNDFHVDSTEEFDYSQINCKKYSNLELALKELKGKIDIVDIVTSEKEHFKVSKRCLEEGLDIIVEKPFCLEYNEVEKLINISIAKKNKIYVGHILRFDIRNRYLKERLSGQKAYYSSFVRNFQKKAHSIYGKINPLYSALIHDIDLIDYLFDEKLIVSKTKREKYNLKKNQPDLVLINLEFKSGHICSLENNWYVQPTSPSGFESEIRIYTNQETLKQSSLNSSLSITNKTEYILPDLYFWPNLDLYLTGALENMLYHYLECSKNKIESPVLNYQNILNVYSLIEEIKGVE